MKPLSLHPLFGNHAIIQRGQPIRVKGWAEPGESVTVLLAGKKAVCTTDQSGRWSAELPPQDGAGEFNLVADGSGGRSAVSSHIRFGEVWLCSGQSNMQLPVSQSRDAAEEIKNANLPMISLFNVPQTDAADEQESVKASWVICSPESVFPFSAVAFFFAREIQPRLGVPVGLINASWGGTVAEAWMPKESFCGDAEMENLFAAISGECAPEKLASLEKDFQSAQAAWMKKACVQDPGNSGARMGWHEPCFDDTRWREMQVPGYWEQQIQLDADGALWFRKKFTIPPEWDDEELVLRLGAIDDFDTTYVNGEKIGGIGPENPEAYRTPRVYTIPRGVCKTGENAVAVRIFDHMGFGGFAGGDKICVSPKSGRGELTLSGSWRYEIECVFPSAPLRDIPPAPPRPAGLLPPAHTASRIFNAMIAPLTSFSLAGVLWYQGESNEGRPESYHRVFTGLIRAWRGLWGRELPFFFVQLANFGPRSKQPAHYSEWGILRDAQRRALALPNTGMASAVDIGEETDIHPKNKQEVGRRLALLARASVYGENIPCSGPLIRSASVQDTTIRIEFDHAEGLRFRGEPEGFAISGEDGRWRRAEARIDGSAIIISHPRISTPVAARYAWDKNPPTSLENGSGLPASPFEWKGNI